MNRARQNGGLGLLSIEERARLVGGDLNILSLERRGTIVHASIPLSLSLPGGVREHDPAPLMSLPGSDVRPPLPERMRPATVLLADDHRLFTDGLVHLLIDQLRVIGAVTDGPALIEAARRLQPDVIIMDLSMPNMSGLDALRQLRHDGLDSKVIVLTMHADARLATEALRAGASGFVLEEESGERALDGVGHADQDDRQ